MDSQTGAVSLIVIPKEDPRLCADYDEDCREVVEQGRALSCYRYDPKRGICPFVGD